MSEEESFQNDEISLFELWEKLLGGWRWIFAGIVVGGLLAAVASVVIPPTYEATAILQTGKVAGGIIEDTATILERLKSPSLLLEVAREVDDQEWVSELNRGNGSRVLTAQIPKTNPSIVEVRIRAQSIDFTKKIARVATAKLIGRQDELSKETLKKIRFDLDVAKEKLVKAEADLETISKALAVTSMKDAQFSQVSLLTSLKLQKESETFGLRQSVFAMELSLLPPATQPAKVLEDIFVPTDPVSPRKSLLLALGLIGGFLAGVMWVFVSNAWRQAKASREEVVQ